MDELEQADEQFQAFATEAFSHDPPADSTVAISGMKEDGKTVLDRTGILLRIGGLPFLITAKHTIAGILDAGYRLIVLPPKKGGQMIAFGYSNLWLSTNDGTDHAVFALDQETADLLEGEGFKFLRLQHLQAMNARRNPRSCYLVAGFPHAWNGRDSDGVRRAEYFDWLAFQWDIEEGNNPHDLPDLWRPEYELLLSYPKDGVSTTGTPMTPPKPNGMSGCGVWFVMDFDALELWHPEQMALVGIQSSWYPKSRCLKVLPIDEALAMIWGKYPAARDSLRLAGFQG